jgi:hypothetical protein
MLDSLRGNPEGHRCWVSNPEFRSEGRRRLRPRSRIGACPRPHLYGWERGRTSSTQHEHAVIPMENPPNGRLPGRYKRQFVRPNERGDACEHAQRQCS